MKKIIAAVLTVSMLSFSAVAFAADKISDWAKGNVNQAANLGIIPESLSRGGDYTANITRVQFAEAIYKLFKFTNNVSPNNIDTPFSDINNSAITSLSIDGIVNGKGDNKFAPDDNLTREEASTIFGRAINKYCPNKMVNTDGDFSFSDTDRIASWAHDYVYAMRTLGIVEGFEDETFRPQNNMSKEEALTIIMRTKDKLGINVSYVSAPVLINEDESALTEILKSSSSSSDDEDIPSYDDALKDQEGYYGSMLDSGDNTEDTAGEEVYTVDENGIRREADGTPVFEDVLRHGAELDAQMPSLEEVMRNAELEE